MLMGQGLSPIDAAKSAIDRIRKKYPEFSGAVIAVNMTGKHGK